MHSLGVRKVCTKNQTVIIGANQFLLGADTLQYINLLTYPFKSG